MDEHTPRPGSSTAASPVPGRLAPTSKLAGTGATGGMTGIALDPRSAEFQQVPKDDKRVQAQSVSYDSPHGTGPVRGYLARPSSAQGPLPALLVVHEDRGLDPHIEDVARRLAVAGYMAFAPDALTSLGGYPGSEDKARELFAKLNQGKTREDFMAAAAFLAPRSDCDGHVGAVGFGYGGGVVNTLATRIPKLGAAVAFYGMAPSLAAVPHIKAPVQLHYAETDKRVNAGVRAYEAALVASHVPHEIHRYPGTQHGFSDETTPHFDKVAAALAWSRTLEFLRKHLRGSRE